MKSCILFLHGTYRAADLPYYRRLCRGKVMVAVDGGLRFFIKAGLKPDFIIGDFDSAKIVPKKIRDRAEILSFPQIKDKTDSHLALDYCLKNGARRIDIVMPTIGEPDHFLGNLMLLTAVPRKKSGPAITVRIINRRYEARCLVDESITINDSAGDMVSIIPISSRIELTSTGCEYRADSLKIKRGDSRPLRNRITARRARIAIAGKALLIRQFNR